MIRAAKISEVRKVTEFMKAFEQASATVKVDVEYSIKRYQDFIASGKGQMLMLVDENDELHGSLGYLIAPDIHTGNLIAVETYWYVDPKHRGHGIKLVKEFERIARERGCKYTAMIHMMDSYPVELEKVYEHMNYRLIEKHYLKELTP